MFSSFAFCLDFVVTDVDIPCGWSKHILFFVLFVVLYILKSLFIALKEKREIVNTECVMHPM